MHKGLNSVHKGLNRLLGAVVCCTGGGSCVSCLVVRRYDVSVPSMTSIRYVM